MFEQGDPEAELELFHGPRLPAEGAHLWTWWLDLHSTRGSGGFGPASITRHDIQAFERDEGHRLLSWERKAIFRIDRAYLISIVPDKPSKEGP
ncbi:MAG TPA: hypothetical protein VEA44_10655 [Caulobacter sp.]|nr:hypothetical protein [Caulobacter sp.]